MTGGPRRRERLARLLRSREAGALGIVLAMAAVLALAAPTSESGGRRINSFLNTENLADVLRAVATPGLVALAECLVIVSGGIDLSVGAVVALAGVVTGSALAAGAPVPVAVAAGLASGAAAGLASGLLVARLRMQPLIATLGMLSIARGSAFLVSGGERITSFPDGFVASFGQGHLAGVPAPFVVFAAALAIVAVVLATTRQGRWVVAIGGNENAARLSGVPVERVKCAVYVVAGLLAALGGIVYAARFSSASSTAGRGYELSAVAAAVIGGASLKGGEGSVIGAFLGVVVLELLTRGLALLGVRPELYEIAIGLAILLAVAAEQFRRRGERRSW